MDIERLPPGEIAPLDSDCIKILKENGRYSLIASALSQCDENEDNWESEAVVMSEEYATYDEAEHAALTWAEGLCVKKLYIEAF
jgi:hypothetical protein